MRCGTLTLLFFTQIHAADVPCKWGDGIVFSWANFPSASIMFLTLVLIQAGTGQGSFATMLLPILLLFLIFYFFIIRPQKKREKDRKAMIAAVRKHDKVITAGGIHGTVLQVDDESVLAEVYTNVKLRIEKSALATVKPRG